MYIYKKPKNIHNIATFVKSIFNKNHNHYYYQIFLEKC